MTTVLVTALIAYIAWLGTAWLIQGSILFPRGYAGPATRDAPEGAETLWIETDAGDRVEAWLAVPPGATAGAPAPLVMFFHGNAELIEHNAPLMEAYWRAGFASLLMEYRGYGRSGGTPSERGIVADAVEALDRVTARETIDGDRVVLHGRSLGGGIAAQVARRRPPAGIILESAFTSVASMMRRFLLPPFMARHPLRTDEALRGYDGPALIVHGTRDTIVPFAHGEKLAAISDRFELVRTESGHNDLVFDWGWYVETVVGFAERVAGPGVSSDPQTAGP